MIDVGDYSLVFFNSAGSKLRFKKLTAPSLTRAVKLGDRVVKWVDQQAHLKHRPVSFIIDRRLYNSLVKNEKW